MRFEKQMIWFYALFELLVLVGIIANPNPMQTTLLSTIIWSIGFLCLAIAVAFDYASAIFEKSSLQ